MTLRLAIFCLFTVLPLASGRAGAPTYTYLDSFGSAGAGAGQFDEPELIALNSSSGEVYVTDRTLDRVEHFDAAGAFVNQWGSSGAANNQFSSPWGIAVDPTNGRVHVCDLGNDRVVVFNEIGTFQSKFGTTGPDSGQFVSPIGMAITLSTSQIYVSENGNARVQRFALSSKDYLGQWGTIGGGDGEFVSAGDVASSKDGHTIYVSDVSKHIVQVFDAGGFFESKIGGFGTEPGKFQYPVGITVDAQDRLYVADSSNDRVQVFSAAGKFLTSFGTAGSGAGQMDDPQDVVISPAGIVYVVDGNNHRVQRWKLAESIDGNVAPVVSFTGKKRVRTSAARRVFRGTATDAEGDSVTVSVRVNRRTVRASGTNSWSVRVRLKPGRNRIVVTATDARGAVSSPVVVRAIRS
jgi:DNA-binding beta-propeller fold protein YncE